MGVTERDLERVQTEYGADLKGKKDDYFALLYLSREFEKAPDLCSRYVAFAEDPAEGINAFHVDVIRRNLYLMRCEWSKDYTDFKEPLQRLARAGMDRIFGPIPASPGRFLTELRKRLEEDQAAIDRVFVQFVNNGKPSDADGSARLDALREDLESKQHVMDRFFAGRQVPLKFQYISNNPTVAPQEETHGSTRRYEVDLAQVVTSEAPTGEKLHVGFVRLLDLHKILVDMGQRLFDRNVRAGLDPDGPINLKIQKAFKDVAEGKAPPENFIFNHNGITVFAEHLEREGERAHITEPRVLNGAQTITSLRQVLTKVEDGEALARLGQIRVLAKIVTGAEAPFVTAVTINTNRQNPVEPANLRANDDIQLDLQDKFRDELAGVMYERQENLSGSLSDDEKADLGFDPAQGKTIELKRLAKTFLASQGEIDRMSRLNDVFETETQYRACFAEKYLRTSSERIVLAYKVQFRLNKVAREIEEQGKSYWYVPRAKNLLWALLVQAILNSDGLDDAMEVFGKTLVMEADFTAALIDIGVNRIRHILREAVESDKYKEQLAEDRLSFLRTKSFFNACMEIAEEKYGWKKVGL